LLIRLPRMQRCPCCGTAMREEAPGCSQCGYGMMDGPDGTGVEEFRYCASCQRVVDKNASQCPVCGAGLD
jgi:RNA polymerase subunit RPABC4/transcription elongation factor Spt4